MCHWQSPVSQEISLDNSSPFSYMKSTDSENSTTLVPVLGSEFSPSTHFSGPCLRDEPENDIILIMAICKYFRVLQKNGYLFARLVGVARGHRILRFTFDKTICNEWLILIYLMRFILLSRLIGKITTTIMETRIVHKKLELCLI